MKHLVLVCAVVVLSAAPVAAAPITFMFEGTVDTVDPALAGTFSVSDPVTVVYTFESTTADASPAGFFGIYQGVTAYSITAGGYNATATEGVVSITDGAGGIDQYAGGSSAITGPAVGTFTPFSAVVRLVDPTLAAITGDALPLTPPDLADFPTRTIELIFDDNGTQVQVTATVDTASLVSEVPTTTGAGVLIMALLLLTTLSMAGVRAHTRS